MLERENVVFPNFPPTSCTKLTLEEALVADIFIGFVDVIASAKREAISATVLAPDNPMIADLLYPFEKFVDVRPETLEVFRVVFPEIPLVPCVSLIVVVVGDSEVMLI